MTYYDLTNIKNKLHIDDVDQDPYLSRLGEGADAYVNTQIGIHATTPISFTDNEIKELADKHAASEYLMWNSPEHPRDLYDAARKDIQDYIKATYGKENADGLTDDQFAKTDSGVTGLET
jgi:hypothetical protein